MNIILNGSNGHMCKEISEIANNSDADLSIVAGVSRSAKSIVGDFDFADNNTEHKFYSFPSFNEIDLCSSSNRFSQVDCIIDFSHPDTLNSMLDFACKYHIPVVIATTGYDKKHIEMIKRASEEIPIFFASNYSMGITLLIKHAKEIAETFGENADIEIVETHHKRKLDAPSGTALAIAKEIQSVLPECSINAGRSGNKSRQKNEIGINSVRMGNIKGIHEVNICNDDECITLKHVAFDRKVFANGAIAAAKFLHDKENGLYNMNSMID